MEPLRYHTLGRLCTYMHLHSILTKGSEMH